MNSRRRAILSLAGLAVLSLAPYAAAQVTCPGSDPVVLDCNGNGTDDFCDITAGTSVDADTNGIPDECDVTECLGLWSGFEPDPPFAVGAVLHGLDSDGDGSAWENPGGLWSVGSQGCPAALGKAIKAVATIPPVGDILTSEYFHTVEGRPNCGAAVYALTFDARSEASLNPRIDWQMTLHDAVHDSEVILIHWASTESSYPGVSSAEGGDGRGRILVKNPFGDPLFINSGLALAENTCYQLQVVLDNATNLVTLFIDGTLRVTTTRLEASAARMDRFRVEQVYNGQTSGNVNRLALDSFALCLTGAALDWPDCNANCVDDAHDPDCNANFTPDECDLSAGTSPDCNGNGVPDECDTASGTSPDCNTNALPDECEVMAGTRPDCNANQVPDECDVAAGTSHDCGSDGVPDECQTDCNTNGWLDSCEIASGTALDCNASGVPDSCDIAAGTSMDLGSPGGCAPDGIPDECQADCNGNGLEDSCDLAGGTSADVIGAGGGGDGVPDECQSDCNTNGIVDGLDISVGTSQDCNANARPDECDLSDGTSQDCLDNNIPDECEADCDGDGIPDECTSLEPDCDQDGIPDDCDSTPMPDCNNDGTPDPCSVTEDCNNNGTLDVCEVTAATDCDGDATLDACQPFQDCDGNGGRDACNLGPMHGYVLNFDGGNDYVSIFSSTQLHPANNFTVEGWVNMRRFETTRWLVGHDDNGGGNDGYLLYVTSDGHAGFAALNGNPAAAQSVESPGTLVVGRWHHLAGVYDHSVLRVYLDGQETSRTAAGDVLYSVLGKVNIGRRGGTAAPGTAVMDGRISDVRFWRLVRTAEEIRDGMRRRLSGNEPGLAGYWKLDDGQGTTAWDSAGPQNGLLVNGPQWTAIIGDCNTNGIPDTCDMADGTSQDCGDDTPDECQLDCNGNGRDDSCDVAEETSADAIGDGSGGDGVPDECQTDCNANLISDALETALGTSPDCNLNGAPDGCENAAPCAHITGATSWRTHGGNVGRDEIVVNPYGRVGAGGVTSEPRADGLVELRVAFDVPPGGPGASPVNMEQRTCGDGGAYEAYSGASLVSGAVEGNELVLTFVPAMENARTYRFTVGPGVSAAPGQSVEVRVLAGDADYSGQVNAGDRSAVVGAWTGSGYSAATDLDLSGRTDAGDRSAVVAIWTGTQSCAP